MSSFWFEIDIVTNADNYKGNWLVYRIRNKNYIAWHTSLPCSDEMVRRMRRVRLPHRLSKQKAIEKCNYFKVDSEIRALIGA